MGQVGKLKSPTLSPDDVELTPDEVKMEYLRAFKALGGSAGLVAWARDDPASFYKLLARMLPTEAKVTNTGTVKIELNWIQPGRLSYKEGQVIEHEVIDVLPAPNQSWKPDPTLVERETVVGAIRANREAGEATE
jgi:hypothetical protein